MNEAEEVTPALFDHAKRVYEAMLSQSRKEFPDNVGGGTVTEEEMLTVYEGYLTRLFADLQIPNPYYTKIINALKGQNCVEQLRRGGGAALSKWLLLEPPTEEGFKLIMQRRRPTTGKQAVLEQRVGDLTRMLHDLDARLTAAEEDLATMSRAS